MPHHRVIIVGGGQAGLSVSAYLTQDGIEHAIFERNRVGHAWREERWDSFCLVTPNWQCRLPNFPYNGPDPEGFMLKSEIVDYVEAFAQAFGAPVREGVAVTHVAPRGSGFSVQTSDGPYSCDAVVVATGGYQGIKLPPASARVPETVRQVHSMHYKSAAELPAGDVLVVGTGQSGAQIAEDLHLAGRRVHLCVGSAPRTARRYRGRDVVAWLEDLGHYDLDVLDHPLGEAIRQRPNHYVTGRGGGRDIDLRAFARDGMQLYGRLDDIRNGNIFFSDDLTANLDGADRSCESIKDLIDRHILEDGIDAPHEARHCACWRPGAPIRERTFAEAGITSIVWCVGFATDYSWIAAPEAFDANGRPRHRRGISPVAGLSFIGLPWLYTWGSGRFGGVARDARYLVDRITMPLPA